MENLNIEAEIKLGTCRKKILEDLARLPGFEECANLDFDKDKEKVTAYVSKYNKKVSELSRDPKFKGVTERIIALNREGRWYKAEIEGVCIGWDPDFY